MVEQLSVKYDSQLSKPDILTLNMSVEYAEELSNLENRNFTSSKMIIATFKQSCIHIFIVFYI